MLYKVYLNISGTWCYTKKLCDFKSHYSNIHKTPRSMYPSSWHFFLFPLNILILNLVISFFLNYNKMPRSRWISKHDLWESYNICGASTLDAITIQHALENQTLSTHKTKSQMKRSIYVTSRVLLIKPQQRLLRSTHPRPAPPLLPPPIRPQWQRQLALWLCWRKHHLLSKAVVIVTTTTTRSIIIITSR